ncbi:MAG: flagellar assembly peptidoglycan hydrolase FlgJ [Pseudomonadota bacterium]|nr:flagellar assembly peptidoglycan hydrolase FlgJ [Pseudomonadota bacterium]
MAWPMSSPPLSSVPTGAGNALSLDALKSAAARDPKAAIKETAKQFEAIFMQQLMKSMREATVSSGMLENSGTQLGTEMLDAQYANKMTGLPGGLADAIARQLERQMGGTTAAKMRTPAAAAPAASSASTATLSQTQSDFVRSHQSAALAAQAQSGIPAAFMIGQAAHESGWGKRDIKNADGSDSHNLFGIKAGAGWTGRVAEITTTEYIGGEAQKVSAKFRAYGSDDEAFRDYARMLKENPRYATVAAQAALAPASAASASDFAQGLQRAGYATDPAYADKLARVINTTLRVQRASA